MLDEKIFVPTETEADLDYVSDIVREEEGKGHTRKEVRDMMNTVQGYYWMVMKNEKRVGAIMYMISVMDDYYMEAIKDKKAILSEGVGIGFSIRVGKMFLDYLFGKTTKILTIARVKDKGIQIACQKLGFKKVSIKDDLVFYQKEKVLCH